MPSFPEEIWIRIFAQLECSLPVDIWRLYGGGVNCSTLKTLSALCLVCRDFRRIAQGILYRTIPLNSLDGLETKGHFARTLTEAPSLGRVTRAVSLDDWLPDLAFDMDRHLNTIKTFPGVPSKLNMQIQKLISSRRWSYSRNGFAVLMLAFMPHVQLVDCTLGGSPGLLPWILSGSLEAEYAVQQDDEDKEDEGNMADQENQESQDTEKKRVITEPSKEVWLPSLKQVRLRHGDAVENTTAMTQLEAILLHPHLESLFLLGVDWTGDEARRMQWNDRISNLTFLELKESIVDASGLQHILTRCKNILNLTIQLGDARREGWDREEDSWQVDLDQFSRVLRKHGRGLTQLDLHTVEYQASNGSEGRLGSLRELSSLKHLGVTKVDLLGTPYERASQVGPEDLSLQSALPQSLETLHLHFDDYYYAGQSLDEAGHQELYELITGGQFPNLYEVKVEFYLTDPSRLFGREIVGWEIHTVEEHLWERAASSGCLRSILVFSRIG